jgi:hypothetical protein
VHKSPHAAKARWLFGLAWLIAPLTALLLILVAQFRSQPSDGMHFAFLLLALAAAMLFGFLLYRSGQYASLARAEAEAIDDRAPILYLRSFAQDAKGLTGAFHAQKEMWRGTFEEQLRQALAPLGPLKAIGVPGESLPPPGARRLYAREDEWRAEVQSLMKAAALVVIVVGKGGAGLAWETEQAFAHVERKRLLLLVRKGRRQYEKDGKIVERASGIGLPAYRELNRALLARMALVWSANCFLAFPQKGGLEILRLRAPWFRGGGSFVAEAHYALRPVYERLGVLWAPPPISKTNVFVTLLMCGIVLLALV